MRVIAAYTTDNELKFYEVTRRGDVSVQSTHDICSGYDQLVFWRNGHCFKFLVHRIVAESLVVNPCPYLFKIVDHIDRNQLNNSPTNLRWSNPRLNAINNSCYNVRYLKRKHKWESFLTERKGIRVERTLHNTFREALLSSRRKKVDKYNRVEAQLIAEYNRKEWKPSKSTKTKGRRSRTCSSQRNYFLTISK